MEYFKVKKSGKNGKIEKIRETRFSSLNGIHRLQLGWHTKQLRNCGNEKGPIYN